MSHALDACWNDPPFWLDVSACLQAIPHGHLLCERDHRQLRALLYLCAALHMAVATQRPGDAGLLRRYVEYLLELTGVSGRELSWGRLAAAQGALERLTGKKPSPPDDIGYRRIALLRLTILACWQREISQTLMCWGVEAAAIPQGLRKLKVVQAFARLFDASALHPRFEPCQGDGVVRVAGFAPIHARHSNDIDRIVRAATGEGWHDLAPLLKEACAQAMPKAVAEGPDAGAIRSTLRDSNAPYKLRYEAKPDRWRLRPSQQSQRPFEWAAHGVAYRDLVRAVLSAPGRFDDDVFELTIGVLWTYVDSAEPSEAADLLAMTLSAAGQADRLQHGNCRQLFLRLASQTELVFMALQAFPSAVFADLIKLAAHKADAPFMQIAEALLVDACCASQFIRLSMSPQGRQALDDCLLRVVEDPCLLQQATMTTVMVALAANECDRAVPSRRLLEHPVLRAVLRDPDERVDGAMLECLLLLPSSVRRRSLEVLESIPRARRSFPSVVGFLSARRLWPAKKSPRKVLEALPGLGGVAARLHLAMAGAMAADSLDLMHPTPPPAEALEALLDALHPWVEALLLVPVKPRREDEPDLELQFLARVMQLTLRLCRGRDCLARLPDDFADWHTRMVDIEPIGTRRAWQFSAAALLACFYLGEAESVEPLNFEMAPPGGVAQRLARLMCAALWWDAGRGGPCRQQLDRVLWQGVRPPDRPDWTDMGLLAPGWFRRVERALFEASATLPG